MGLTGSGRVAARHSIAARGGGAATSCTAAAVYFGKNGANDSAYDVLRTLEGGGIAGRILHAAGGANWGCSNSAAAPRLLSWSLLMMSGNYISSGSKSRRTTQWRVFVKVGVQYTCVIQSHFRHGLALFVFNR